MKKKVISISVLGLMLVSCANDTFTLDKITPTFNNNLTSVVVTKNSIIQNLVFNERDFILFVGNDACSTCVTSLKYINKVIAKRHMLIYHIQLNNGDESYTKISSAISFPEVGSSTMLFVNNGKVLHKENYSSEIFFSDSKINTLINKYVNKSGLNLINDIKDNEILNSSSSFSSIYNKKELLIASDYDSKANPLYIDAETDLTKNKIVYYYNNLDYENDMYENIKETYSLTIDLPNLCK